MGLRPEIADPRPYRVGGIVGILRGAEFEQSYSRTADGRFVECGAPARLDKGLVTAVSPAIGDFHRVSNALNDELSVSIHVYRANIGAVPRSTYEPDGTSKMFQWGYSNTEMPNLWDRLKGRSRFWVLPASILQPAFLTGPPNPVRSFAGNIALTAKLRRLQNGPLGIQARLAMCHNCGEVGYQPVFSEPGAILCGAYKPTITRTICLPE